VSSALAFGQVNRAGQDIGWTDNQNNGAFTHSMPIDVPPFHGIEPHLALQYSSASSFGLMGVGWSLSGISSIERTSLGRGAPSYDGGVLQTADMFLLDGEELLACPTGSQSPSCKYGGNFTSVVEGYEVIKYSSSNDTWTITDKGGNVRTYAPVWQEGSTNVGNINGKVTWRYGLQSVSDPMGNTVTYSWAQNLFAPNWSGPSSITYNGNTITINYTPTPATAPIGYSDGITMYHIHGVIQSVDVQVSGSRARTYQFSYTTSSTTGQDLLTSVRMFGKDAVLDGGAVVSGTSLPPMMLGYSTTAAAFTGGPQNNGWQPYNTNDQFISADVNGDGYQDLVTLEAPTDGGTSWTRQVWFGSASGNLSAGPVDYGMDYNSTNTGHYLVADLNGDGKSDMIEVCGNSAHCGTAHYNRHIWLSNGNGFTSGALDTSMSYSSSSQYLTEDVNGDGKVDMVELYPATNWIRHIWLSTGSAFTSGSQDTLTRYTSTPSYYLSADLNGDGKGDMIEIHIDSNNANWDRQLWMSNGSSFVASQLDKTMPYNVNTQFYVGDFNGDGQQDLVELMPSGNYWLRTPHVSMGNFMGNSSGVDSSMVYQSSSATHYYVDDFNGDGHADMLELSNAAGQGVNFYRRIWPYTPANQESFVAGNGDTGSAYHTASRFVVMDVNGDGLNDVVELWPTTGNTWGQHIWLNSGPGVPDLLTSITDSFGGTTTVAYKPSTAWSNTNNPPLMQTVSSVTVADGRGGSATTNYSYSGGLFDWSTMKFQGFQTVKVTEPCLAGETSCPYTVSTYDQPSNCGSISPLLTVASYDGSGNLYTKRQTDITYNCSAAPFTALPTGEWAYTYNPTNSSQYKRTYESLAYDAFGNVTQLINYGDYDVSGDETTEALSFNYNTSAYLVAHPATESIYAGTTTGGALLSQTLNYYDCDPVTQQNCNNSAAPTKGAVNRVDSLLNMQSYSNPTASYVTTKTLYDSHGNPTDTYDANNNHTSVAYDTTYNLYAVQATNALGQSATSSFDYLCGTATSVTNLNQQTTNTTLDALCRPTQVSLPNGGYTKMQYLNFGNPTTQYEETDTPGPSGDIYARAYFDGLGRTYKSIARGVSADTEVDKTYDARNNVATVTAPYFVGGSSVVSTNNYDALDRLTKVTLPDNNTEQTFYGPNSYCNGCSLWSVTGVDALGHKQTNWLDGNGHDIQHDEYVGGSWNSATYAYDLLGRLSTSTDPSGNVMTYTVDSLDRTVGVNDPDEGLWTYTYDSNGNLLTVTDALVTPEVSYAYDALNRLTSKTTSGDGNTFTWTYDQSQAGYYNVGRLTTKTDPYGSQTFNYDNVGNVVATARTTDGVNYPFSYTYDIANRLLTESFPDGDSVGTVAYDAAGQLLSVPSLVTSVAYDPMGRPTQLVNPNGTTQTRTYDAKRLWLTGITTTSGTTNLQSLTYGFDADGNRTSVTSNSSNSTDESWTYGYDELHRVVSAVDTSNPAYGQTFSYNAAGNIVSNSRVGSYSYPAQGAGSVRPHAVTSAGGNSYAYNANGQMTSRAGTTLSWNGDHLMSNDGSNAYYYGGSRELLKLVNGANTTRYLGDDFEVSPNGTQNKYLTLGGQSVVRVGTGSNATRWIHADFNGSIQVQSDGAGAESMRKKYYVTGDALSTTGTDSESKGFTDQRQESSGLTYLHERFYDPLLGRFISPDPVTPGQHGNAGLNRYAYAMNDFVNKEDTSGFMFPAGDGGGGYRPVVGGAPHHSAPAWTPVCYYCYRPTSHGPVDLGGNHTYHPGIRRVEYTYHAPWTPICYYCYRVTRHGPVDLGGNHTRHWGLKSCPIPGCYKPAHHSGGGSHIVHKGGGCNWLTLCLNRHWRGAVKVAAVVAVVAALCVSGVCEAIGAAGAAAEAVDAGLEAVATVPRFVAGATIESNGVVIEENATVDLQEMLDGADEGSLPKTKTFHNWNNEVEPQSDPNYYKESWMKYPGRTWKQSPERFVWGKGGERFYTPSHDYAHMIPIK
jgi:RHS repeat-associated protein